MAAIVAIEKMRKGNSFLDRFWEAALCRKIKIKRAESIGGKRTEESIIRTKIRGLICRQIEKDCRLKCLGGRKKGGMV